MLADTKSVAPVCNRTGPRQALLNGPRAVDEVLEASRSATRSDRGRAAVAGRVEAEFNGESCVGHRRAAKKVEPLVLGAKRELSNAFGRPPSRRTRQAGDDTRSQALNCLAPASDRRTQVEVLDGHDHSCARGEGAESVCKRALQAVRSHAVAKNIGSDDVQQVEPTRRKVFEDLDDYGRALERHSLSAAVCGESSVVDQDRAATFEPFNCHAKRAHACVAKRHAHVEPERHLHELVCTTDVRVEHANVTSPR